MKPIQCGSCEQISAKPKNGNCPKCGSGNWVYGYIDKEEEVKE